MFRPFGICHVPLPESHIEGGEKKKASPREFKSRIPCLPLNMSHFKRSQGIDLWEESLSEPCAWPRLPAQPEPAEDAKSPEADYRYFTERSQVIL